LRTEVAEDLYLPMENLTFVKKGTKSIEYDLRPWTLIGATTQPGELPEPFLNRFGINLQMDNYSNHEMAVLINQAATKSYYPISIDAVEMIASRCRSNPRIANALLDRCYDYAIVENLGKIDEDIAEETFKVMGIDKHGLTDNDRKYLQTLYTADRPVGVQSLVPILHTDKQTIMNSIEPYLVEEGYVILSARGRQLSQRGLDYVEGLGEVEPGVKIKKRMGVLTDGE